MKMKQIMFRGAALGLLLVLTACGGAGSRTREQCAAPQTADAEAVPAVVEVDSLLADAASLVGRQVRIEGICTHICKHGGRKIFLMGSAPRRLLRIEAGERIGSFSPECVNRPVRVTGTVCESRIDEAYLAAWEARLRSGEGERHGDGEGGCTTEKQALHGASPTSGGVLPSVRPARGRPTCRSTTWRAPRTKSSSSAPWVGTNG